MPCKENGSIGLFLENDPINDWARLHPYVSKGRYFPNSLRDLVVIVQDIEQKGGKAKAVGSLMSLSNAPDSDDYVIDISNLKCHLSQPYPLSPAALPLDRYKSGRNLELLKGIQREGFPKIDKFFPGNKKFLVHVEAGIKIKDLLEDLANLGLALPTMGAGGRQGLIGAISTSTHGSDVNSKLLGDFVRAVHLVGPTGQEWWIEGDAEKGGGLGHTEFPDWCNETKIVRDSDFLSSVIVAVGRFGIIYSLVLEVVPQYRLEQLVIKSSWLEIRNRLVAGIANGYDNNNQVFNNPLSGFPLRFYSLVVDSTTFGETVWVTRRWKTDNLADEGLEKGTDIFGALCNNDAITLNILIGLIASINTTLFVAAAQLSAIPCPPGYGTILAAPYYGLIASLNTALANYTTLGNFMAAVIEAFKTWGDEVDLGTGLLDDLISTIWNTSLETDASPGTKRGASNKILDTYNYNLTGCMSVNASEFAFDASSPFYLDFVNDVLMKAIEFKPMVGYVSLRFVRQTSAKLGTQRHDRTVTIEIAVLRPGSDNTTYFNYVHELALEYNGIPHWGQQIELTQAQVENYYGKDLETWKWALSETESLKKGTFSSDFTRSLGLEPNNSIEHYRALHYVAAIISGTY